jgi:crotonobetainyl-CoA:carnitine CoA-transferase CaiB-like acyl-CoA transferase
LQDESWADFMSVSLSWQTESGRVRVGDLDGMLVVALEQAVAAPYCSSRLADAGARVIKVERAEGDFARGYDRCVLGQASYFVWLNRGKESLVLDIKRDEDKALLHRILARADVFIQNLAPGAAARAGFGSAELRACHPALVTCDISGYGEAGPYRDMKAYDLLVQAETGLCQLTGGPESAARVGVSVCDIAAGMSAHAAILQALLHRFRTGQGRGVQVSLFSALADWMNVPWLQRTFGGLTPARTGVAHPTIAPYGAYPCRGGDMVVISIQNEREWRRFAVDILEAPELLEDPRFADNATRVANRLDTDSRVAAAMSRLTRTEAAERLQASDIAFGFLNTLDDFAGHPQLATVPIDTPAGPIRVIAPPASVVGETPAYGPVPAVGAHSALIRAEFG